MSDTLTPNLSLYRLDTDVDNLSPRLRANFDILDALYPRIFPPWVFDANASPYNCVPNTGVDQTANWQSVLNAAGAYALIHGAALILASDGVYTLSSALTQNSIYNAQLILPYAGQTDQRPALGIYSKTQTHNPTPYRYPGAPLPTSGVILYSTLTPSYSSTYGCPFILSGPNAIHGISAATINYFSIHTRGVAIRASSNPSIGGFNFEMMNRAIVEDFRADTLDPNLGLLNYGVGLLTATVPTHPTGIAILMPTNGMDATEYRGFAEFTGWYAAAGIGELTNVAGVISCTMNTVGLNIQTPFYHGADIGHCILTRNKYGIAQVDPSSGIVAPQGSTNTGKTMIVGRPDFERYTGGAWDTTAEIYDPNNCLVGSLEYFLVSATGGGNDSGPLLLNGAGNLRTVNLATPGTIRYNLNGQTGMLVENPNAGASAQAMVGVSSENAKGWIQAFPALATDTELRDKVAFGSSTGEGVVIYTPNTKDIDFYTDGVGSTKKRFGIKRDGGVYWKSQAAPAVSASGQATVYLDSTTNALMASLNAGAFLPIIPAWTSLAYNAGDYTTNTGTWTVDSGDLKTLSYTQIGKLMTILFSIHTSTLSGSPVELYIPIPNSKTATVRTVVRLGAAIENGTDNSGGSVKVEAAATRLVLFKPSGVAWANGTNNCYFEGQITFQVN